jgi:hypothetical protein
MMPMHVCLPNQLPICRFTMDAQAKISLGSIFAFFNSMDPKQTSKALANERRVGVKPTAQPTAIVRSIVDNFACKGSVSARLYLSAGETALRARLADFCDKVGETSRATATVGCMAVLVLRLKWTMQGRESQKIPDASVGESAGIRLQVLVEARNLLNSCRNRGKAGSSSRIR